MVLRGSTGAPRANPTPAVTDRPCVALAPDTQPGGIGRGRAVEPSRTRQASGDSVPRARGEVIRDGGRLVITKISDFRTTAPTEANEVSEARSRRRKRGERREAVPEVSASGANQGSRSPRRPEAEQERLPVGRAPGGFRRSSPPPALLNELPHRQQLWRIEEKASRFRAGMNPTIPCTNHLDMLPRLRSWAFSSNLCKRPTH
jgi:hypothetical protein